MKLLYGFLSLIFGLGWIYYTYKYPSKNYKLINHTDFSGYLTGALFIFFGIKLFLDHFGISLD